MTDAQDGAPSPNNSVPDPEVDVNVFLVEFLRVQHISRRQTETLTDLFMFRVLGIIRRLDLLGPAPDPTAVIGRSEPSSTGTEGKRTEDRSVEYLFEGDQVLPVVTEIVGI